MHIIIKNFKQYTRDKGQLFFSLLFPILLTFILGTMLAPMYEVQTEIEAIHIEYVNSSDDVEGVVAFENFLHELEKEEIINVKLSTDLERSKVNLAETKIDTIIELTGEDLAINMITGEDGLVNQIVQSMIKGYIQNEKIVRTIIEKDSSLLMNMQFISQDFIDREEENIGFAIMDYYGIAMIIMTIFMVCFVAAIDNYSKEKADKTIIRLQISSKDQFLMFIQTNLSVIPQIFFQIGVLMVGSVLLLDVTYCDTLGDNLLLFSMLVCVTLAIVALGSVFGLVCGKWISGLANVMVWTLLFFSGTYSKEVFVEGLSNYLPPYMIQQAAFDLTLYGNNGGVLITMMISLTLFVVFSIMGAVIFSKRRSMV